MTSQTLDSSIARARQSAVRRPDFLERSPGDGFQLNLNPTQSRRDQVVDPGADGAEHETHRAIEKRRKDS